MRMLARFDRPKVEAFAEISIALLDLIDGDPDLEEDDDPGQCTEDEVSTNLEALWNGRPGCAISDPEEDDDPAGGNIEDEPQVDYGEFDTAAVIPGGGSGDG
jgi:hypothetical protein